MKSKAYRSSIRKAKLWQLGLGLLFVFLPINAWLRSNRDIRVALQYSNETQRIAGYATQFVILLVGVGLILFWLRSVWLKPKE